jgi:hypothetical protein
MLLKKCIDYTWAFGHIPTGDQYFSLEMLRCLKEVSNIFFPSIAVILMTYEEISVPLAKSLKIKGNALYQVIFLL